MRDLRINTSAPNLVNLCIDRISHGNMEGWMYHKYTEGPVGFHTVQDCLLKMDALFDRIGYPQTTVRQRNFKNLPESMEKEEAVPVSDAAKVLAQSGELVTFVVHVNYRQNATWQGEVVWADTKQRCRFRSALELLKLIDGALDEAEGAGAPEAEETLETERR